MITNETSGPSRHDNVDLGSKPREIPRNLDGFVGRDPTRDAQDHATPHPRGPGRQRRRRAPEHRKVAEVLNPYFSTRRF